MRIWYHCQFGAVDCTSDLVLVGSSKGFERDFIFFHNRTKLRALRKIDLKWQIIPLVKYRNFFFSECANTLAIACLSLGWWLSKCSYTADWPHPLFNPRSITNDQCKSWCYYVQLKKAVVCILCFRKVSLCQNVLHKGQLPGSMDTIKLSLLVVSGEECLSYSALY